MYPNTSNAHLNMLSPLSKTPTLKNTTYDDHIFPMTISSHSEKSQTMMNKSKKFIEMGKKWQKVATMGRRVSSSITRSPVADKGHFVVYSSDMRRFVVPLEYHNTAIFRELFRMSEEEYGLPRNGPIILPCNAIVMEYVILFVRGHVSEDMQQALLDSIDTGGRLKYSLDQGVNNQQMLQCF